jgi:hypothetical protein
MKMKFRGHETFFIRKGWLHKGMKNVQKDAAVFINKDPLPVDVLGMGNNMVKSLRYWLQVVGMTTEPKTGKRYQTVTDLGKVMYENDPYFEELGTLWLLHLSLINVDYATIYKTVFVDYHHQRNIIEKNKLQNYIKHICFDETSYQKLYNENTVKRDIGVMLHNYCVKTNTNFEDTNTLFAPLNLIRELDKDVYVFNYQTRSEVPCLIFLYALLIQFKGRNSISFEEITELSLIFCLTNNDLLKIIKSLCNLYPSDIVFSDVAGIKELQFHTELNPIEVLNRYYED